MTTEKRDFNSEAAEWDKNPGRIKMGESIFKALTENLEFTKDMDLLDFGCGTGLLSLQLLPLVNSVTGADSSTGMLEVFNLKIAVQNIKHVKTIHIDIDRGDTLSGRYDAVISTMTMHHIKNPAPLLKQLYSVTKPGGYLCIADLDSDNGLFHDNTDGVFHQGFNRDQMKIFFSDAGFTVTSVVTAAEMSKPDTTGKMNNFSIFLMIGRKN